MQCTWADFREHQDEATQKLCRQHKSVVVGTGCDVYEEMIT